MPLTYKDSGVDIEKAKKTKEQMKQFIQSTFNKHVPLGSGAFGGAFLVSELKEMKEPVLISSVDGVGTKTKIAIAMNKFDTIGFDILGHCANDIVCLGAKPLFFFDYIGAEELRQDVSVEIVKGLSNACRELGIPLVAGETAEMPGVYEKKEIDLVGCIVGVVEKSRIIDGKKISKGDVLIGLPSNGLHTNGYSLARKVFFEKAGKKVHDFMPELNATVGEALMVPHRDYSKTVLKILEKFDLHGIAHITGSSFAKNIGRLLPDGTSAIVKKSSWKVPQIFRTIQNLGDVPEEDMYRAFNMGIGMVLIAAKKDKEKIVLELKKLGEKPVEIGQIAEGKGVQVI